jgi:DNA-binding response OmpR family regulator
MSLATGWRLGATRAARNAVSTCSTPAGQRRSVQQRAAAASKASCGDAPFYGLFVATVSALKGVWPVHVLVVEDEPPLLSYLVPLLQREGFEVTAARTGAAALAICADRTPGLVLLDVGLPDLSGLEVCRELRRRPGYVPVVMLTGLDSPADELAGFAVRADDYIAKPVQPELLLARIRAVLRLAAGGQQAAHIQVGDVTVDLQLREARRDGRPLELGVREFDLLAWLAERPGQVFGKTQLLAAVWGPDFEGDPHTVESRMSRVRIAVEDNPNSPRHVHTRRGVGYFLTLEARQ